MEDVRYTSLSTPIGVIWVAASSRGVCRIALGSLDEEGFVSEMSTMRRGARLVKDDRSAFLRPVLEQLREYFRGERRSFRIPIDLDGLTPFRKDVLRVTGEIPHGGCSSYGDVAHALGKPGAARAVGAALGSNPVPIVIPCHRVLARNGSIGGFSVRGNSRSIGVKRCLLALEGAALPL